MYKVRNAQLVWGGLVLLSLAVTLAGCAATDNTVRLSTATPDETAAGAKVLQPGSWAPDFTFIDRQGNASRLSAVRGRVTVVLFPDNPQDWPDPEIYRRAASLAERSSGNEIPVVLVNVGRPMQDTEQMEKVLKENPVRSDHLVMVADPTGTIAARFGQEATGKYFVIDNYGKIMRVGTFAGIDALRDPIRDATRLVADDDTARGNTW
jgi:peroxiredoxin